MGKLRKGEKEKEEAKDEEEGQGREGKEGFGKGGGERAGCPCVICLRTLSHSKTILPS